MSVPFFAKSLFDYEAVEASELSVNAGDVLTVEEVNESGWCLARKGDSNGWIPTDYVQRIETEVGVEPEPIQVSKPLNSRELQAHEAHAVTPAAVPAPAAEPVGASSIPAADQAAALQNISASLNNLGISSGSGVNAAAANQKICAACNEPIKSAFIMAKDKAFHTDHFTCETCKQTLGGKAYLEKDGKFYCENDYYAAFNPKCGACQEVIKGPYISALDQSWHPEHFVCTTCSEPFDGSQFRKHNNLPYCEKHFEELFAPKCSQCGKSINGQVFEAMDQKYHLDCFTCAADGAAIGEGVMFHVHENKIYCPTHFESLFLQKCVGCGEVIRGQFLKVLDQHFHAECWKCTSCSTALKSDNCAIEGGKFFCKTCIIAKRQQAATNPTQPVLQQSGSNPQAVPAGLASAPTAAAPQPASSGISAAEAADKATAALNAIKARQAAEAEAAAAAAAAASSSSQSFAEPGTKFYDYALLKDKNSRPSDVDPARKELYLSDADFEGLFKMNKADFGKLPEWRKKALKTPLMLF